MGSVHAKDISVSERNINDEAKEIHRNDNEQKTPDTKQINLEGVRARVDRVNIDGLSRTKDDLVHGVMRELFSASDFQGVIREAQRARSRLEALGCFRNVGVFIDTSKGVGATPDGLEVTFAVRELSRVVGGVNTAVGSNEGSLIVSARLPNMFGRAEKLDTEFSYGSKKTSGFLARLSKPWPGNLSSIVSGAIFQTGSEWPWSGYQQVERGVLLDLAFFSLPYVKHNLQWEGAWRELSTLSRSSAFDVREQSGPTLKSAVRHIVSYDGRDECIFPTRGAHAQFVTEFAGLGGNVGFLRNELTLQANMPLPNDWVAQVAWQSGWLHRLAGKTVSLCDQFYLGGPLSLRGFGQRGVGPHSDGFSLGSDVYWAAGVHVFAPLPFRPGRGGIGDLFRTHFFANFGNVGNFELGDDAAASIRALTEGLRLAVGLGLAVRLGQLARVELNYCFPIRVTRGDEACPGVQFGVGVNFL